MKHMYAEFICDCGAGVSVSPIPGKDFFCMCKHCGKQMKKRGDKSINNLMSDK
jgi:hypothetical protein